MYVNDSVMRFWSFSRKRNINTLVIVQLRWCTVVHSRRDPSWLRAAALTTLIICFVLLIYHLRESFVQPLSSTSTGASTVDCGQICSTEYASKEEGRYYELLRKHVNCDAIMYRMAYSPFQAIRPPPRQPPPELRRNFTLDGLCSLGRTWYVDNSVPRRPMSFSADDFARLRDSDRRGVNVNQYRDKNKLKPVLEKYVNAIHGRHVVVIGTRTPWAEAILLNLGAANITTMEYSQLHIDSPQVRTFIPPQYAQSFLNGTADRFDTAFSYSSIEHSGLGRYGDPLMPYGDFEAMAQVWCSLRPGGLMFLAMPMARNHRTNCSVVWNAHRLYGYARLQHLTANWRVLDEIDMQDPFHFLYVIEKVA